MATGDDLGRARTHFGLALQSQPEPGATPLLDQARLAEQHGFDSVWLGDHLFFRKPQVECVVALGAIAGATNRIGLGTGVLLPALRPPVPLIKQLTSLALLSGGRLHLGVGAGGEYVTEWEAVGADLRTRGAAVDDFLDLLAEFEGGGPVDFTGRLHRVQAPAMNPLPAGPIPVWVGGRSDAALARAARVGGGWLGLWASASRLRAIREQHPGMQLAVIAYLDMAESSESVEAREAGWYIERSYRIDIGDVSRWIVSGPREQLAAGIAELAAAADMVVLHPAVRDPSSSIGLLSEIVAGIRTTLDMPASRGEQ